MFKKTTTTAKEKLSTDAPPSNQTTSDRSTSAASNAEVTRDAIAQLAFQKWQKRGCRLGEDQRDWFDAERELKSLQSSSTRRG